MREATSSEEGGGAPLCPPSLFSTASSASSAFSLSPRAPLSTLSLCLSHGSLAPHTNTKKLKKRNKFQLDKASAAAARWRSTPASDARRRQQLAAEVSDESRSVSWQLDEVSRAVDVAASDPARLGLSPKEVEARRRWVAEARATAASLARSMTNSNSSSSSSYNPYGQNDPAAAHNNAAANDAFLGRADGAVAQVLARQDAQLDDLGAAVSRIGEVGLAIHGELHALKQHG